MAIKSKVNRNSVLNSILWGKCIFKCVMSVRGKKNSKEALYLELTGVLNRRNCL